MSMTTTREQLWSDTGVQAILNIPDLSDQQRDYILRLRSSFRRAPEIDADALKLSVDYHRPDSGHGRRVESSHGLQGASDLVRRFCSAKYYRRWDIDDAHCVILEGILKAHGISCPLLHAYMTHTEDCISKVDAALHVGDSRTIPDT
jgi:hypothetical protein